jgi:hypothetical protein
MDIIILVGYLARNEVSFRPVKCHRVKVDES